MSGSKPRTLNILFVSAEADPFVKVGGLGDYAGSLPPAIKKVGSQTNDRNIDIRIAVPYHRSIDLSQYTHKKVRRVKVNQLDGTATAFVYEIEKNGIPFYFIRRAGNPRGYDHIYNPSPENDAKKYIFFSLACIELTREINWQPDILHANDWHTAVSLQYLEKLREKDPFFKKTKSLLVIHNMPFMGQGSQETIRRFNIKPAYNPDFPSWAHDLPLPIGMDSADRIITVSHSYAEELKTEEFGDGLAKFFQKNSSRFGGIVNGIDTEKWDPRNDVYIFKRYSASNIRLKTENKIDLLTSMGMEERKNIPLFVMITRLTHQKGIDIILQSLPKLQNEAWTGIILGSGDQMYENGLEQLQAQMPEKLRVILEYNAPFSHALYAGGDFFLMPSLYEPCGISQMIAMRYGCIPLANSVGGLKDTITPQNSEDHTGYLIPEATDMEFIKTFKCALHDFQDQNFWKRLQERAMLVDFSWEKSARKYVDLYYEMLDK
jgi:starch synthase